MIVELSIAAGAFLQELVPFPSFLVFVPGGAALQSQGAGLWHVVALAFGVGIARVLAGLILYWTSVKLNDILFSERRSWLGLKQTQLNRVRDRLGAQGSWWTIFALWSLPIVPSMLISLAAGFVKTPIRTFVTATYAGSIINALTYLLIGYYGLQITAWLLL